MSWSKPYHTVTETIQDREAFRAVLARLDIDSLIVNADSGNPTIAIDKDGMEQLRTWFAEHGDQAQADAIRRALDRALDEETAL